jgi:luciferase family oxidoreductase group 1
VDDIDQGLVDQQGLTFGPRAVPFSVLDLAPVPDGGNAGDALRATIDLARHAERLGFRRFWVAEHHNMPGIASSAPPVLIGHIADATDVIRVGSGGVMLPNHVSLVVAEQFGMLEALHPGRIDLGIGRAPGTDQVTAAALRRSPEALSADDFPGQLMDLLGFFTGRWPDGHPFAQITAVPGRGNQPAMWLLGSSGYSAQVAGMLGLPFAFAHHFSPANTLPALALYREHFRPSETLERPYAMVAAAVVCAATDDRARWLAGSGALSFLRLRSGRPGRVPSPEEAAAYPYTEVERAFVEDRLASNILGSPETVNRQIAELLTATAADELMITTMVYDPADRLRSFELVADLRPGDPLAPALGAAVGEDLPDHVAAGDASDAAAAVGGRAGLVQAPDRRAQVGVSRRGPGVEHLPE